MNYRKAKISDIPGIVKIHVDTWKVTYQGIFSKEYLQNLSYEINEIERNIRRSR